MVFEVKQGAYQPLTEMDTMAWAPAEGQPGTAKKIKKFTEYEGLGCR